MSRTDNSSWATRIPFVVRDDARHSDILLQTSDTTWQAYNASPLYHISGTTAVVEGHSLYDYPTFASGATNPRAYKVSYNRSHRERHSGVVLSNLEFLLYSYEYPFIRFLESQGFDVAYTTGRDSDARGSLIRNHRVFATVGHDEYWSGNQRANIEAARDAGVNLAFFSGNSAYWKVRWEDAFHTLVCFKEPAWGGYAPKLDPLAGVTTSLFRDPRFGPPFDGYRPENALLGQLTSIPSGMKAQLSVTEEEGKLRFWRDTPLATEIAVGQSMVVGKNGVPMIGYEMDADVDNGFRPVGLFHLSTSVVDSSTNAEGYGGVPGIPVSSFESGWTSALHSLALYRAPSGALVFSAGTMQLAFGLAYYNGCSGGGCPNGANGEDTSLRQAIVNLFADMDVQPTSLQSDLQTATKSTDSVLPTVVIRSPTTPASAEIGDTVLVAGTASDLGGAVAGVEVSTDGGVTWRPAAGRTAWSYRFSACSLGTRSILARAVDDSGNLGPSSNPTDIQVVSTGAQNFVRNGQFDCGFDDVSDVRGQGFFSSVGQRGSGWFHWSNSATPLKLGNAGLIAGVNLQRIWAAGVGDGVGQNLTLEAGRQYTLQARVLVEACPPGVAAPCSAARARLSIGALGAANDVAAVTSFNNRWETLRVDYTPTQPGVTFVLYSDLPNSVFKVDDVWIVAN